MAIKVSLEIDGSNFSYHYEVGDENFTQTGKVSLRQLNAITQAMHIMCKSCETEHNIWEKDLTIKSAAEQIMKKIGGMVI